MGSRTSVVLAESIEYGLWLIFDQQGGIRMTRTAPFVDRDERAMALTLTVPRSVFRTPQLSARIAVQEGAPAVGEIDIEAVGAALKQTTGLDFDLRVVEPD
jgi:hypothetical protein